MRYAICLSRKDAEPTELIYFKVCRSQVPVIGQAIETAAPMLASDKSRGYCLEMICADFLASAHLQEDGDAETLYIAFERLYQLLPRGMQQRSGTSPLLLKLFLWQRLCLVQPGCTFELLPIRCAIFTISPAFDQGKKFVLPTHYLVYFYSFFVPGGR